MFSGIGGFHRGLELAGHKCVGACEIDPFARSIYARHFPETKIWGDITKINTNELPNCDTYTAGFPCPSFSVAGRRLGFDDPRGKMVFEIFRIARKVRPGLLLLENVPGIYNNEKGETFRKILQTMDELGYDGQWQSINSSNFVPQNRNRVFFIFSLRGGSRPQVFPIISDGGIHGRTRQKTQRKGKRVRHETCGTIDSNYRQGAGSRTHILEPKIKQLNKTYHQQGRVYDPDGISRTICSNGGGQGANTGLYAIPVITPARKKIRHAGRRFKTHGEPAFTLTTQDEHGIYDGKRIRSLTPLECERVQGFPDNWTQFGADGKLISDRQRYRCTGNAVTVPVITHIGELLA